MICFTLPSSGNALSIPRLFARNAQAVAARDFEASLARRWGVPADRILQAGSGSAALYALLRGLARNPSLKRVAIPAWGRPTVAATVRRAGLEPVRVDMDPATLGYDTAALTAARGPGLLAVILTHHFALSQPIPAGDWEGTTFIRDCTQDFDHRPADGLPCIYSFGRMTALSAGQGGALCIPAGGPLLQACRAELAALPASSADPRSMAAALNLLSNPRLNWALSHLPFLGLSREPWAASPRLERLSPGFQRVGVAALEAYTRCRPYYRSLIRAYRAAFATQDDGPYTLPGPSGSDWLPNRFPVRVRDAGLRQALLEELGGRFGGVARMYPEAPGAEFPGARLVAQELITLPVNAAMRDCESEFLLGLEEILEHGGPRPKRTRAALAFDPIPDAATEDADWSAVERY